MLSTIKTLTNQLTVSLSNDIKPDLTHPLHLKQVLNLDLLKHAKDQVKKWYGLDNDLLFPGSIPVSLMRSDIKDNLYYGSQQYLVTYKTDGIRCLLFLTICSEQKLCFWMDRGGRYYLFPYISFPNSWFNGTILDCELIKCNNEDPNSFSLQIFDVITIAGKSVKQYELITRLTLVSYFMMDWMIMLYEMGTMLFHPQSEIGASIGERYLSKTYIHMQV